MVRERGHQRRRLLDAAMRALCALALVVALLPLASLLGYVVLKGFGSLSWALLTELPRPVGDAGGGVANALVGSLLIVGLASLLAVPVGVMAGLYLAEFGGTPLARLVRFGADVLAGVPSIVVGVFVYAWIVVTMGRFSAFAGAAALAVLALPTIARGTEEMVRLVPGSLREAALALGVPVWRATLLVVLRTAAPGIATAVMLAVARISGETAPLLFTAFSSRFLPDAVDRPAGSLPVQIFTYAVSPYESWHQKAWGSALLLVLLVMTLNGGARLLVARAREAR